MRLRRMMGARRHRCKQHEGRPNCSQPSNGTSILRKEHEPKVLCLLYGMSHIGSALTDISDIVTTPRPG